jgi:3-phenylpropionate/trans-cinnamate dioxygenase ferredoxin reductase subunit
MEDRVMSRVICPVVSDFFQKKHEAEGVNFKFNVSVIDIEDSHNQKQIKCTDGTVIDTDAVVIGVGIKPNIELAVNSGLLCQDGIVVDENGQTSDDSIFAAGDCTNHPNNIYHKRLRLESVHNAVEQAKSVAASISGENKPYHQVPWFWSDQYNLKLQIAGISKNHDQYVVRGDIEEEKFTVFYLKKKKIIAVDTINNLKEFFNGKKLIAMGAEIPLEVLQNKNTNLKELIKHY